MFLQSGRRAISAFATGMKMIQSGSIRIQETAHGLLPTLFMIASTATADTLLRQAWLRSRWLKTSPPRCDRPRRLKRSLAWQARPSSPRRTGWGLAPSSATVPVPVRTGTDTTRPPAEAMRRAGRRREGCQSPSLRVPVSLGVLAVSSRTVMNNVGLGLTQARIVARDPIITSQ
jgi:hypothetical protein